MNATFTPRQIEPQSRVALMAEAQSVLDERAHERQFEALDALYEAWDNEPYDDDFYEPDLPHLDYELGVCMAGHYGKHGDVCYAMIDGRLEECGEFV